MPKTPPRSLPLSDHQRTPGRPFASPTELIAFPADWPELHVAPHTPETVHLGISNVTPEELNALAHFAAERASFFARLAEQGRAVTLTPEQLDLIADTFGQIAGELGDGVSGIFRDGVLVDTAKCREQGVCIWCGEPAHPARADAEGSALGDLGRF